MPKANLSIRFGTKDISILCGICQSLDFDIPREPKPDDTITCLGCGETGNYGEFISAAIEQVGHKRDEIVSVLIRGGKPLH